MVSCPKCNGSGYVLHCKGRGKVGGLVTDQCRSCDPRGSGKCNRCKGKGSVDHTVPVVSVVLRESVHYSRLCSSPPNIISMMERFGRFEIDPMSSSDHGGVGLQRDPIAAPRRSAG